MEGHRGNLIGRLFIADPGLCDDLGHHYTTSVELAREAAIRGIQIGILAAAKYSGQAPVQRTFRRSLYQPRLKVRFPFDTARRSGPLVDQNSVDMLLAAEQLGVTRADSFLFHTTTVDYLASMIDYFVMERRDRLATHHFVFRFDPESDDWAGGPTLLAQTVQKLKSLDLIGRQVFLYAETDALAHFYSELTGAPVAVMYHFSIAPAENTKSDANGPVRVGFFGEARLEKGFDAYHRAVDAVLDSLQGRAKFVTQCYTAGMNLGAEIEAAGAFFWGDRYRSQGETFGVLGELEYQRELTSSDVLVLAHRTQRYARRGSGIFVDGITHDKVMVLRAGTWMSTICPPELLVLFGHDGELPAAIQKAVERVEARRRTKPVPNVTAGLFDLKANLQEVLRNHVSAVTAQDKPRPLRVLHIAPLWLRQGSTRVYESQLRALSELGASVMCVHLANFPMQRDPDENTYRWFLDQAPASGAVYQWLVATVPDADEHAKGVLQTISGKPASWSQEWMQAQTFEIPASLANVVRNGSFDLVVLNYAHNLPLVQRLGLSDILVIVETHDIRARQFAENGNAEDTARDEAAELAAVASASGVVFINRLEAEAAAGSLADCPHITVLPTLPQTLDRSWHAALQTGDAARQHAILGTLINRAAMGDDNRAGLCEFYVALRLAGETPGDLICFLGSTHRWNMLSLDWFYDQVFVPFLLRRGVTLVIAGRAAAGFVAQRGPQRGVIALGEVQDVTFLYESGMTFVLPVQGGTGFPIKTLEALAAGNRVVGTSQAFRGFPDLAGLVPVADTPDDFARAVLACPPAAVKRGGKPVAARPDILDWEYYRDAWAGLITKVTGRKLQSPQPWTEPEPVDLPMVDPLRALALHGVWTCDASTQPDFLAASRGFAPGPSETGFSWTGQNMVVLAVEVPAATRAVALRVAYVVGSTDAAKLQEAVVFRDGAYVGRVLVTPGSTIEVPLPVIAAGTATRRVEVELVFPSARHGLDTGGWRDNRHLALAISGMEAVV